MSDESKHTNSTGHGGYEHRDISPSGVLYFLIGLALAIIVAYFVIDAFYHFLDKHFEAEQTPVSPLVTNAPKDTRRIPPQYHGDYAKYLKEGFPSPQLEVDERTELNDERLREEDTLSTYGYIDKDAGIVRIPIDRAMDLIAQRGLPVRQQPVASPESKGAKK
jgi:hypothetical protein